VRGNELAKLHGNTLSVSDVEKSLKEVLFDSPGILTCGNGRSETQLIGPINRC